MKTRFHRLAGTAPLVLLAALAAAPVLAQPWEEVLGPPNTREQGEKRVAQVRFCSNDGYVSVGTLDVGGLSQAYVVRTKANGNNIFEIAFDIGDDGQRDEGNAIVELSDGTGFVILGSTLPVTTLPVTSWNIFLLEDRLQRRAAVDHPLRAAGHRRLEPLRPRPGAGHLRHRRRRHRARATSWWPASSILRPARATPS